MTNHDQRELSISNCVKFV